MPHSLVAVIVASVLAGAAAGASVPSVPACVSVSSEARYRGYGYDHVVRISSGCDKAAACSVSTDVNPDAEHVTVRPSEAVEVVTFRGSPAREFAPRVECKLF